MGKKGSDKAGPVNGLENVDGHDGEDVHKPVALWWVIVTTYIGCVWKNHCVEWTGKHFTHGRAILIQCLSTGLEGRL
jgi:hypothetical protein